MEVPGIEPGSTACLLSASTHAFPIYILDLKEGLESVLYVLNSQGQHYVLRPVLWRRPVIVWLLDVLLAFCFEVLATQSLMPRGGEK